MSSNRIPKPENSLQAYENVEFQMKYLKRYMELDELHYALAKAETLSTEVTVLIQYLTQEIKNQES